LHVGAGPDMNMLPCAPCQTYCPPPMEKKASFHCQVCMSEPRRGKEHVAASPQPGEIGDALCQKPNSSGMEVSLHCRGSSVSSLACFKGTCLRSEIVVAVVNRMYCLSQVRCMANADLWEVQSSIISMEG
jgi:hypothetical protein